MATFTPVHPRQGLPITLRTWTHLQGRPLLALPASHTSGTTDPAVSQFAYAGHGYGSSHVPQPITRLHYKAAANDNPNAPANRSITNAKKIHLQRMLTVLQSRFTLDDLVTQSPAERWASGAPQINDRRAQQALVRPDVFTSDAVMEWSLGASHFVRAAHVDQLAAFIEAPHTAPDILRAAHFALAHRSVHTPPDSMSEDYALALRAAISHVEKAVELMQVICDRAHASPNTLHSVAHETMRMGYIETGLKLTAHLTGSWLESIAGSLIQKLQWARNNMRHFLAMSSLDSESLDDIVALALWNGWQHSADLVYASTHSAQITPLRDLMHLSHVHDSERHWGSAPSYLAQRAYLSYLSEGNRDMTIKELERYLADIDLQLKFLEDGQEDPAEAQAIHTLREYLPSVFALGIAIIRDGGAWHA